MPNLENFLAFPHWQYELVRHLLQLTVASFAAGFVYFLATASQVEQRYRLASIISAVVMVSAVLEIGVLSWLWSASFSFSQATGLWQPVGDELFSNGFRYINWSIDVPLLLTQLLIVLGLSGKRFWAEWWKLATAGLLMIWTGYPGQFYEAAVAGFRPDGATWPFWFWGAVSTVFFVYLLWKVGMLIGKPPEPIENDAHRNLKYCWYVLLASWAIYPVAYAIPAFLPTSDGATLRQLLFTVADISSKLGFGVMLGRVARMRSLAIGFKPTAQLDGSVTPVRADVTQSLPPRQS